MRQRRSGALLTTLLTALAAIGLLAGCEGTDNGSRADSGQTSGTLTVFAAASLKDSFEEIADGFEQQHPGVSVRMSFAGSSDLATQIISGAPADVFASADEDTMSTVRAENLIAERPRIFATNTLTIAVPAGNPAGIRSFADLSSADVTTVVCAPQVPCGSAAQTLQDITGIQISPVSEESSVTDVLGKVRTGQADAGLVYVTDIASADGAVDEVPISEAGQAVNRYPIAAIKDGNEELAEAFVDFVTGEGGQQVLSGHGFGEPQP
ncbi:molybdate ABC transporter substrate-binding protein [Arthrobacter roseus]